MAQKRNPISLRLQTRLQGHEKRFASCWFTDYFFSQAYTNDLMKRLYLGHLLGKGGSWYGERDESGVAETCISIQSVYRRCFISSVVLDKRKQEYIFSSSSRSVPPRQEAVSIYPPRQEWGAHPESKARIDNLSFTANVKDTFFLTGSRTIKPTLLRQSSVPGNSFNNSVLNSSTVVEDTSLFSPSWDRENITDKKRYLSIANSFASVLTHLNCSMPPSPNVEIFCMKIKNNKKLLNKFTYFSSKLSFQEEWKNWLYHKTSSQYVIAPDLAFVSTIESICDTYTRERRSNKNTRNTKFRLATRLINFDTSNLKTDPVSSFKENTSDESALSINSKNVHNAGVHGVVVPLTLATHWTSLNFIRATSTFQSVEFCLHSVAYLYKKRVSFSLIKEILFKMLATSGTVHGARLVCSGRQGGRSKSAMRAKKQSAVWGQTALSLFSSRLAFASKSVDTSFGQVGIKIWICYK